MDFVSFHVTNSRGNIMNFCLDKHKADIIIEKVINMGTNIVTIDV